MNSSHPSEIGAIGFSIGTRIFVYETLCPPPDVVRGEGEGGGGQGGYERRIEVFLKIPTKICVFEKIHKKNSGGGGGWVFGLGGQGECDTELKFL